MSEGQSSSETLADILERSAKNRRAAEATYRADGLRATGFDDLLRHLHVLEDVALREADLARLVFFARRLRHDVEVGLVAAYHGMPSVGADAMRDMMEAWLLLRHFAYVPAELEAWFTVSRRERKNRFGSNRLRQLHSARVGIAVSDLRETMDYNAHSMMLHVTPEGPFRRGVVTDPDEMLETDLLFAEILSHSLGAITEFHRLAVALHSQTACPMPGAAPAFMRAADNAQEFTMAFVRAAYPSKANGDGR